MLVSGEWFIVMLITNGNLLKKPGLAVDYDDEKGVTKNGGTNDGLWRMRRVADHIGSWYETVMVPIMVDGGWLVMILKND